jgi:hypothetical protein
MLRMMLDGAVVSLTSRTDSILQNMNELLVFAVE